METITRNVRDIPASELQVLEHLIGVSLRPDQQVIVQVVETESGRETIASGSVEAGLPDWCNVYEGLSDGEVDRLDAAIQRRLDLTLAER
jgi:hypothetical protein